MEQPIGRMTHDHALMTSFADRLVEFAPHDLLDLNGKHVRRITRDAAQPNASIVTYRDDSALSFAQIARIIPCFTAHTLIATPDGERPAQALRPGDKVLTRDNGFQPITWAGRKQMTMRGLPLTADMRPIRIRKGAFGANCPERDMVVSPNHRMLIIDKSMSATAGETEVLLAAKHMTHLPGVAPLRLPQVTYIHFMCAQHEIVFSDGTWTETFQPNDDSLHGIDAAQRDELLRLFPELVSNNGRKTYGTARATVTQAPLVPA